MRHPLNIRVASPRSDYPERSFSLSLLRPLVSVRRFFEGLSSALGSFPAVLLPPMLSLPDDAAADSDSPLSAAAFPSAAADDTGAERREEDEEHPSGIWSRGDTRIPPDTNSLVRNSWALSSNDRFRFCELLLFVVLFSPAFRSWVDFREF